MPTGPPSPKARTAARPNSTRVWRIGLSTCHTTQSTATLLSSVRFRTSALCQSRSSRPRCDGGVSVRCACAGSVGDVLPPGDRGRCPAQLAQRHGLNLSDALTADAQGPSDVLERLPPTVVEAEAAPQDLS